MTSIALVTGARGGIGRALCAQLQAQGWQVAAVGRDAAMLADVPADARRPEIEFQFALAPTRIDALLALLHRYGVLTARSGFGTP